MMLLLSLLSHFFILLVILIMPLFLERLTMFLIKAITTTDIYTLSLHDALPIWNRRRLKANQTGKKFRVGIKSNISTNRNNLISGVDRCIHLNAMKKTTITSINRQTIKI